MVITILEAQVAADKAATLEQIFTAEAKKLDPGIVQTFLIRSTTDAGLWRILTVWESREALAAMRDSGETPRGVVMFRAAGAEPTLTVFSVAAHASV